MSGGDDDSRGVYEHAQRVVLSMMGVVFIVGALLWIALKIRGARDASSADGGAAAATASEPASANATAPASGAAVAAERTLDVHAKGSNAHSLARGPASDGGDELDAGPESAELAAGREKCAAITRDVDVLATRELASIDGGAGWLTPDLLRRAHCVPIETGGAWAALPTHVRSTGPGEYTIDWRVVHVASDGLQASRVEKPFVAGVDRSLDVADLAAFDFDGDGEPELVLHGTSWARDGAATPFARVYTFKKGVVAPYPGAPDAFVAVEDVDGDGRPDLVGNGPYAAVIASACSGASRRVIGPALAAHSVSDGGFSSGDEAAAAFAKRGCPAPPETILASGATATNLACARLWGKSEAEVAAAVARECKGRGDAGDPCGATFDGDDVCARWTAAFRAWAHATPPVTLK